MTKNLKFDKAVEATLKHEGGYVHNPADPGGATNYGVSLRFALAELKKDGDGDGFLDGDFDRDGDVDADDIKKMTVDDAKRIYKECFWDRFGYDRIDNFGIAAKVFDMSVNMGPTQAHKIVQRSCNDLGAGLTVDGRLGPASVAAINRLADSHLLDVIREMQAHFYLDLISRNPKLAVFQRGWINRSMV